MTDKEILEKAIQKAKDNGFKIKIKYRWVYSWLAGHNLLEFPITDIIFSHEFAKAFWGELEEYKITTNYGAIIKGNCWKFHLQQMVLEPEPLKYIEKFLEK